MSQPFLGELRVFSFGFAPRGWAQCNGQLIAIQQNQGLFSLLGTTYGGDGRTTFALPDLRGRVPVHPGMGIVLGERLGNATETLTVAQYAHGHSVRGQTGPRVVTNPSGAALASGDMYGAGPVTGALASSAVGTSGQSQAHSNMQPYLVLGVCISLAGVFPSRN